MRTVLVAARVEDYALAIVTVMVEATNAELHLDLVPTRRRRHQPMLQVQEERRFSVLWVGHPASQPMIVPLSARRVQAKFVMLTWTVPEMVTSAEPPQDLVSK